MMEGMTAAQALYYIVILAALSAAAWYGINKHEEN